MADYKLKVVLDVENKVDASDVKRELHKIGKEGGEALDKGVAEGAKKSQKSANIFKSTYSSAIDYIKNKAKKASNAIGGFFDRVKSSFHGVNGVLAGVGLAFSATAIGKRIITLGNNLQQAQISFETMLGSAELAKQTLQQLSDFAAKTPFELTGIRENAKQLLAMGVAQADLIPTLKALGDVSAGLNVPLERLALNYGQVLTQGKLTGKEMRDFTVAGVPLLDELAKKFGKSKEAVQDMISAGLVSSDDMIEAFQTMTSEGGKFADLMTKQSQTLGGVWSNLQDTLDQLLEKIGLSLIPLLTDVVNSMNETAAASENVGNTGISMGEMVARGLSTIVYGIQTVVTYFRSLGKLRGTILGSMAMGAESFANLFITVFTRSADGVSNAFKVVGNNIKVGIAKGVQGAIDKVNGLLNWIRKELNIDLGNIGSISTGEYQEIPGVKQFKSDMNIIGNERRSLLDDVGSDWKALGVSISNQNANIKGVFRGAGESVSTFGTEIDSVNNKINNMAGGGGSGVGKAMKDNTKIMKKELEKQRDLKIKAVQESVLSEKDKMEALNEIKERYDKELIQLQGKTNDELLKEAEDFMNEKKKQYLKDVDENFKAMEKSADAIDGYLDKIEEIKEKYEEVRKEVIQNIKDIDHELSELDLENVEKLGQRFVEVQSALQEIEREHRSIQGLASTIDDGLLQTHIDAGGTSLGGVELETLQKYKNLQEEMSFIIAHTTEEQRKQAKAIDALSESEKSYNDYLEKRAILEEKRAINDAFRRQTDLGQNKIFYDEERDVYTFEDEKGAIQDITDYQNEKLAQQLLDKQLKLQQEHELEEQHIKETYNIYKTHQEKMKSLRKSNTDQFIQELRKREQAARATAAAIQRMNSMYSVSPAQARRAYGGTLNMGKVTLVGENGPEKVISRMSSYVQPANSITTNTTTNSLAINGVNIGNFNTVDDMLDMLRTKLSRHF